MEQKRKIFPPIHLLMTLAAMTGLHVYLPIWRFLAPPNSYVGIVWIVAGIVISATAARSFRKVGTPVIPFERSAALVTAGLYRPRATRCILAWCCS
jgi:protein-S-isoprenylcysteine O-methyltransferase Ste14